MEVPARGFVTAGIEEERAVLLVCVFQCDPYAAHEAVGDRVKMYRVTVGRLLGANMEVQRLEGNGLTLVKKTKDTVDFLRESQCAHTSIPLPHILHPIIPIRNFPSHIAYHVLRERVEFRNLQILYEEVTIS